MPIQSASAGVLESAARFSASCEAEPMAASVSRSESASAPQAFASTVFFARPTAKRVQPRARSVVSSRPSKSSFAMVLYRTMGPAMHWWKSAA